MNSSIRSVRTLAVVAVTAAATVVSGQTTATAAAPATTQVPGTVPAWLSHAQQGFASRMAVTSPLPVRVYLQPRGGTAQLEALASAVSTPGSSQYGKFLSVGQYNAAFQPTAADAATVADYLRGQGLTSVAVSPDRRFVAATGGRLQVAGAFGVTLASFRHDGQDVVANTTPVRLPTSVAARVLTVTGLDTTVSTVATNHVINGGAVTAATTSATSATGQASKYPSGIATARPCSAQYGQLAARYEADFVTKLPTYQGQVLPYAPCGYNGTQMRGVYAPFSTLRGGGATIGIVDAFSAPRASQDAATYARNNGDAAYRPGQYTESAPPSYRYQDECEAPGWSAEQLLDIEAAHGMAPDANIRFYAASSCTNVDITDALARVVQENKVDLVSNSYGGPENSAAAGDIAATHQVILQGTVQGISFLYSSGDSGDYLDATGQKTVSYPASDPLVTSVGGTTTGVVTGQATSTWTTVTGWGTGLATLAPNGKSWVDQGFLYGSGGGYSQVFNRPAYQTKAVPTTSPTGRAVPDISANADTNTGLLIGLTQAFPDGIHYGEFRIGGTSLASPLLAGYFALATGDMHKRLGALNPRIYTAGDNQIVDVTAVKDKGVVRADYVNQVNDTAGIRYTVRTFDQDSSLTTTAGWDDVTGTGFPDILFLEGIVGHKTRP